MASFQEAVELLLAAHKREVDGLRCELSRDQVALEQERTSMASNDDPKQDKQELSSQAPLALGDAGFVSEARMPGRVQIIPGTVPDVPEPDFEEVPLGRKRTNSSSLKTCRMDNIVPHHSDSISLTAPSARVQRPRSGVSRRERDGAFSPVSKRKAAAGSSAAEVSEIKWEMHRGIGSPDFVVRTFSNLEKKLAKKMTRQLSVMRNAWKREDRFMYKVVKSWYFVIMSYTLIIANCLFIGASMQHQLNCAMSGCVEEDSWWDHIELAFDVAFTIELVMKFVGEDVMMFVGKDWTWNCLDLFLVVSAIAQRAAESGTPKITVTRTVRLFRVTRILRVLRVVKICQSLRVMIFAILRSLDALLWVFAVLIFFNYMFAMIFIHATTEEFLDRPHSSSEHLDSLEEYFGSLYRALVTLFQSITNGRDWSDVYNNLWEVHAIYALIFLSYVYFTVFLVMNVVIGTVVDMTSRVALRDRERIVSEEMARMKEYSDDIRQFFDQADTDKSGSLSWEEFSRYLEDDKTKARFQALDLDISHAHVLFDLLDENGDGEVGVREFLDGCIRLKGPARSIDLHFAIFQLQQLINASGVTQAIAGSRSCTLAQPDSEGLGDL